MGSRGPTAVAAGSRFGISGKTIKLCYISPKTGTAPLPPNVEDAIQAYWYYLNKKHALGGYTVSAEICDTQSTVAGSQAAAQKAIDIKSFAVTTLEHLGNAGVIDDRIHKSGIPNVVLLGPPNPSQSLGDSTFFVGQDQATQGDQVAKYFAARKMAKVAVVAEANDANNDKVVASFLSGAKRRGLDVVSNTRVDPSSSSGYSAQCAQVASKRPDAVWLFVGPTNAIQFVNACGSFKPLWFSGEFHWDLNICPAAAPAMVGAEGFGRWATLSEKARIAPFQQAFQDYVNSGKSQGGASGNTKTVQDLGLLAWGESQIVANGLSQAIKSPAGLGRNTFLQAMHDLKLGSTSPVDGTPLLWAPLDFTGGKLYGAPNTTSVWKVGSDLTWQRVSGYQTDF